MLQQDQVKEKIDFINRYIKSTNHSNATEIDPNANVEKQGISPLSNVLFKDAFVDINRQLMIDRLIKTYDEETAKKYIELLENHYIYVHDETHIQPYCASINMYPFLKDGLTKLGGNSKAPKHLGSFCGGFINLCYIASAELAGAIATVEFLMHFTKFFIDDYGTEFEKNKKVIEDSFAQVVYSLNQPAGTRGFQSVFWNISLFDKYYYESMFDSFYFPYGETKQVEYKHLDIVQKMFMKWFNKERTKSLLTFPVVTAAVLNNGEGSVKDKDFIDFLAGEMSEGNSFFTYQSASADSLSSCCRLRNELSNNDFSYSLGAGGVATGSIKVITLNINRITQSKANIDEIIEYVHKFLIAYRSLVQEYIDNDMINIYSAKLITIDKQFLTIGVNGMLEAAESKGVSYKSSLEEYNEFVGTILDSISKANKRKAKETGFKFNTEFVPAENLGVKNSMWDKKDGYKVPRDCYNSYFFDVADETTSLITKFELHGEKFTKNLDGGAALHLNLNELLTKDQAKMLFDIASKSGCYYWTYNVPVTICEDCSHISKQPLISCPACDSKNVGYATRIIGYLRPVKCFSKERQQEHGRRHYA